MIDKKQPLFLILIASCIISFISNIRAQDAKADFNKANLAIAKEKELYFDITYNFYCSSSQTHPSESSKSKYAKKDNAYYTFSYGVETISSDNILLMVNVKEKTILINKQKGSLPLSDLNSRIEKTLKYCKKTDFKEDKYEKIYILIIKNIGIDKIEIHLRKEDAFLTKVIFFQNETVSTVKNGKKINCKDPKTEVLINNIIKKTNVENEKLTIKTYVALQKDGSYKPIGSFKNFKVEDLRKKSKK
ncbi:MAG: hypothetical protein NTZ33_14605 [Bacteroidetes bacterium]|nr:hypothetical protein [Bacteroidota bacterium]